MAARQKHCWRCSLDEFQAPPQVKTDLNHWCNKFLGDEAKATTTRPPLCCQKSDDWIWLVMRPQLAEVRTCPDDLMRCGTQSARLSVDALAGNYIQQLQDSVNGIGLSCPRGADENPNVKSQRSLFHRSKKKKLDGICPPTIMSAGSDSLHLLEGEKKTSENLLHVQLRQQEAAFFYFFFPPASRLIHVVGLGTEKVWVNIPE